MRNSLLFSFAAVGAALTLALPAAAAAAAPSVGPLSLASGPSPFAGCTGGLDPGSPPGTNYVNAEVEPFVAVDPFQQRREIVRDVIDRRVRVADRRDPARHGREIEVVRLDVG